MHAGSLIAGTITNILLELELVFMPKITFLGNCSNQTADFDVSNFVIEADNKTILVDAGPGIVKQLYRNGYEVTDLNAIIITHSHADHSVGFPYLMFTNFYERASGLEGPNEIDILATDDVYNGLRNMWEFCYPPGEYDSFSLSHTPVKMEGHHTATLGGLDFITVPVSHTVPTFGFRVSLSGLDITYSSDTVFDETVVDLASGTDILIHEGMATDVMKDLMEKVKHGRAREAGRAAQEADADRLLMTHAHPRFRADPEPLLAEAAEEFDGKIDYPDQSWSTSW